MQKAFTTAVEVCKVNTDQGLVFGYACVCTVDGQPYFDLQDEHIPEDVMLDFATDFMKHSRQAKAMHEGDAIGEVLYALPMTADLAKALDITVKKTGLIIGMSPDEVSMKKFADGEFKGFSIGGTATYKEVA